MSEFTGDGFKPFPNTYSDNQRASEFADEALWPTENLEHKIHEYGEFLTRQDIMERARLLGNRILDLALFELACRDGIYGAQTLKSEDELCEGEAA